MEPRLLSALPAPPLNPSARTFHSLLQSCILHKDIASGSSVCSLLVKCGMDRLPSAAAYLGPCLVRMFSACGCLPEARHVFESLPSGNAFTWCAIISAHTKAEMHEQAMALYARMLASPVLPDGHVFAAALQACAGASALAQGKLVHMQIVEGALEEDDEYIGSTLLRMYSACGAVADARRVLDDLPRKGLVTWSAMISEYVRHGEGREALSLLREMRRWELDPDAVALSSLLKACSAVDSAPLGSALHSYAVEEGCDAALVVANALADMYVKCGALKDACEVFAAARDPDVVTWTVIISGYVHEGLLQGALAKLRQMRCSGVEPSGATLVCLLGLCAALAAIDAGNAIHTLAAGDRSEQDASVAAALVHMYMRCGSVRDARSVFARLPCKTVAAWGAMIQGLAKQGEEELAFEVFGSMQRTGVDPDGGTLVSLLSASGHAGFNRRRGLGLFASIARFHNIRPSVHHFNCIADMLGRSGFLGEAEDLLVTLHANGNLVGWLTLLAHCGNRGNAVLGKRCFDQVMGVDCNNAAAHALMSSIYFQANMLGELQELERSRISGHG